MSIQFQSEILLYRFLKCTANSNMKLSCIIFIALGIIASANAQVVNIQCTFQNIGGLYTCSMFGITLNDNENADIVIGGLHFPDRGDADVERVQISFSSIPFIITQFFTTFPNLADIQISGAGLQRIQSNAFANARNLRTVSITLNNQFRTVNANAFNGASDIRSIDLSSNAIDSIHETAFTGATTLEVLFIQNNQLETIEGRLLANNTRVTQLNINSNQVNAIGRTFLDSLTGLQLFGANDNVCVNQSWVIGGTTTIETVRQGLTTCFNNSAEPPPPGPDDEVRRFILELRGPLTIRNEDGSEIITI